MEKLDRFILINDLSSRLCHNQTCTITLYNGEELQTTLTVGILEQFQQGTIIDVKPHLVPYTKMPKELSNHIDTILGDSQTFPSLRISKIVNIFLRNHIDFNNLLYKKLAIETNYQEPEKKQ